MNSKGVRLIPQNSAHLHEFMGSGICPTLEIPTKANLTFIIYISAREKLRDVKDSLESCLAPPKHEQVKLHSRHRVFYLRRINVCNSSEHCPPCNHE